MPTLITHATPPPGTLPALALPNLQALLRLLPAGAKVVGEDDTLSPLHERLQAQALGLSVADGLTAGAALQALGLGLPAHAPGWAWLTPCHWQVNADHVRMADPVDTQISEAESTQVMDAMRAYLQEDGITLHGLHQGNWLAQGAVLHALPTASLARAGGGAVDHWLPRQAQAQPLRRLQNEMQMLLYTHPVNDQRSARGLLPINSFWVSGTGSLPPGFAPQPLDLHDGLRAAAERKDLAAWLQAWQALDAGPLQRLRQQAQAGEAVTLTLCGAHAAQTFSPQPQGLWARLRQRLATPDIAALLHSL